MHPPPIDVGIVTSGSARAPAEDLEHPGPGCCAVYRGCNALPRISELSADAPRTSGSTSPDIHVELSRSLVHKLHLPWGSAVAIFSTPKPNAVIDSSKCFAKMLSR